MSSTISCGTENNDVDNGWLYTQGPELTGDEVRAKACFTASSRWFDGHFPDQPILPGIALLALATDCVFHAARARGDLQVAVRGLTKVRFNSLVKPGQELRIRVSGFEASKWRQIRLEAWRDDQRVFMGTLLLDNSNKSKRELAQP